MNLQDLIGSTTLPRARPSILITPLLHPAAVVRGLWNREPAQEVYLRRVRELGVEWEPPDVSQPPPNSILYPTLSQLEEFVHETQPPEWNTCSIDLETCGPHIICAGLTQVRLPGTVGEAVSVGRSLCLRFRVRGGGLYWSPWSAHRHATALFGDLLGQPGVGHVFHNGVTFDVPVLQDLGFKVEGRLLDTMILHHTAYSEFPKSLQWCATFWLGMGIWKTLVEEDDEEEGKG